MIDLNKKTPYKFVTYSILKDQLYKIIHTVNKGPGGSHIVSYEIEKYNGEKIER